jgi:hypothetical protein
MVDAFAVVAPLEELPAKLMARYGDLVTRVSFYAPYRVGRGQWKEVLAALRAL